MSVEQQATRVASGAKSALKALIQKLGGTVPDSTKIDGYVDIINAMDVDLNVKATGNNGNIVFNGAVEQTAKQFLNSLTIPGLNYKYINPVNSGTVSSPYGLYIKSGASLVDTILGLTEPGIYTVYMNRAATDVPEAAQALNSSLRGLVCLSQLNKHYAYILMMDQSSNFYVQYIQNDVGAGWQQLCSVATVEADIAAITPEAIGAAAATHADSHKPGGSDAIAPADIGAAAASHTHTKSQITDFPSSMAPSAHNATHKTGGSDAIAPADIGAAEASHTHDYLPLSGGTLTGNLNGKYLTGTWLQTTDVTDKTGNIATIDADGWIYYRTPAEVLSDIGAAAASHSHAAGDITSGTLPIARGGTGATTATAARSALGAQAAVVKKTGSLTVAGWSSKKQTISVAGVTASNCVIVAPAPASQEAYVAAGVKCTTQASGKLTFTCQSVPTAALTVNVAIL